MTADDVARAVEEWQIEDAKGDQVYSYSELLELGLERARAEQGDRQAAAIKRLLSTVRSGVHLIEEDANWTTVRSIFKSWVDCTVGYRAPAEMSRADRERSYDIVIGVVDRLLGEADRTASDAREARREREGY